MKKVKDSLTMNQKSDLSRGIALKNAAEARRLETKLKSYESHLHQNLVDLDAEIMDLRLSPLLRRKAPAGRLSPVSPNRMVMHDTRPISAVSPIAFNEKENSNNAVITDLNSKQVIPSITVIKDGPIAVPNTEIQPGFLPKIRANSAGIVGNEQTQRPADLQIRPHTGRVYKLSTIKSNSTDDLPSSSTLELPHESFQRSRSFGEQDSVFRRPRSSRRVIGLPEQGAQTLHQPTNRNQQQLEDRVKKFLKTPNPVTETFHEDENSSSSTQLHEANINENNTVALTMSTESTTKESSDKDKIKDNSLSSNSNSSLLTNGNHSLARDEHRLDDTKRREHTDLDSKDKEQPDKEIIQKEDPKQEPDDEKLERKDTITQKERKTGTFEQPEILEREKTEDEHEDIPSATGIPALDKLLLARAIADAEGSFDSSQKHDFDEILRRRLEALLKDPPTQEELRKIRYLRLPEDKMPDILASVFGNENGSIVSVSHEKLSREENTDTVENPEQK